MLNEIALLISFLEVVGSDVLVASKVGKVWVDVQKWFNSILLPAVKHLVPIWVLVVVQLPVPQQSHTLWELECTNPVLKPNSNHWHLLMFEEVVAIDHFLL